MSKRLLMIVLILTCSIPSLGVDSLFLVGDEPARRNPVSTEEVLNPTGYFSEAFEYLGSEVLDYVDDLKSLIYFQQKSASNSFEPYNRQKHFGSWIRPDYPANCRNTRANVLISRSEVDVEMSSNGCTVKTGQWYDLFSGRTYTHASDVEIDHVVPLKNAYINGAHSWSQEKRCVYANYVGNEIHLMPVESNENRRKSDLTPEKYLPSNRSYTCGYLRQWLKIKLYWRLTLTESEKDSVVRLIEENQCELDMMTYSAKKMQEEQKKMREGIASCQ